MKATTNGTAGGATGHGGPTRRIAGIAAAALLTLLAACDSAEERAQDHLDSALELIAEGETVKGELELRNALKLNDKLALAHLEFGKILESRGNLQGALVRYRTTVELDESLYEGHLRYGQILLAANQLDQALRSSNTAFQLAPDDLEVLTLKAATAYRLGNYESARETLDRAFAIAPDDPKLWLLEAALRSVADAGEAIEDLGEVRTEEGAPVAALAANEGSLEAVTEGLRRNPDDFALALARIGLLAQLGRREEAVTALAEAVERHPEQDSLLETLVREQLRSGQIDAAEQSLRQLYANNPDEPERALDIVRIAIRTRGIEAGLQEIDRIIAELEDPADAWPFTKARIGILIDNDRSEEAEALLVEAIETLGSSRSASEARVVLARMRLIQGRRAEGEAQIAAVLAVDETNAEALALKARLAIRDQDYDTAIADLRKAVREDPENVTILQLLATAHRRNGNRQLAGERLADAVEASDQATEPVLDYVRYLVREGNVRFAIELVEEVVQRRPSDRPLLEALASLYLATGDYVLAEKIGEHLASISPEETIGNEVLAAAKAGQQDYEASVDLLASTREKADDRDDLRRLVLAYARAGRMDEANAVVDERLAKDAGDAEALRLKGLLTLAAGNVQPGLGLLNDAIEAEPGTADPYLALSRAQIGLGNLDAARETLVTGVERTDSDGLRMALAITEERLGNVDGAIDLYRAVLSRQPGFDVAANNFASLLSDTNPTPEQIEEAYRAAKRLRGSSVPQYQDTYGWLLHLRGESADALPILMEAAEGLPEHPVVLYHLGAVQATLGQADRARETLEKAIELAGDAPMPQVQAARELLAGLTVEPAAAQ